MFMQIVIYGIMSSGLIPTYSPKISQRVGQYCATVISQCDGPRFNPRTETHSQSHHMCLV